MLDISLKTAAGNGEPRVLFGDTRHSPGPLSFHCTPIGDTRQSPVPSLILSLYSYWGHQAIPRPVPNLIIALRLGTPGNPPVSSPSLRRSYDEFIILYGHSCCISIFHTLERVDDFSFYDYLNPFC